MGIGREHQLSKHINKVAEETGDWRLQYLAKILADYDVANFEELEERLKVNMRGTV